ncbi:MAG: Veg family protein [Peptoniphilaceae bacterium]|nr:Veg family protein [Peptoniphilaceae bacterium]MDY6086310.1 Veg family protein [Peptoniphilaceae bacterium]
MQENNQIQAIRNEVEQYIGHKVVVRADKGRKRIVTKEGVIENAFDEVFTVRISNSFDMERTVSYTYTDVLTSTVQLTVY